jgi:hypothetical protein
MINTTAAAANSNSASATPGNFKMMPWTKKIRFVKPVLVGAGWLGLLATASVAQMAVMPGQPAALFRGQPGAGGFARAIHRSRTRFPIPDFPWRGASWSCAK